MKKVTALINLSFLLYTSCATARQVSSVDAVEFRAPIKKSVNEQEVKIRFLHYNDFHAHLVEHTTLVADHGTTKIVKRGGLARLKTLVDKLKKENPNNILMNVGDTFHGGVEALYTDGNAIVEPINYLGIDVGVPGNWDYAYGPAITRLRYTNDPLTLPIKMMAPSKPVLKPNFINIAANVKYESSFMNRRIGVSGRSLLPETYTKDINGVRVGFIGITSDIVQDMHKMLAMGLDFVQGESSYLQLIEAKSNELKRNGADIVVVMSELGLQKDFNLANKLKENTVDVFFSAHTHEATFVPLTSKSGAMVVEAGDDTYLGVMDITIKGGKILKKDWQLRDVDSSIEEDEKMLNLVNIARAPFLAANINMVMPGMFGKKKLIKPINTVIGKVANTIDRKNALESQFNNAFTDLLRKRGQTQIAMTPGFRFDNPIYAEQNDPISGQVTLEDVYRFFPVVFSIATAKVKVERLKEIMESNLTKVFSKDIFKQSGGWADGYSGIDVTVDLANKDGEKVIKIQHEGKTLGSSDELTITGCRRPMDDSDVICSYNGFSNVKAIENENGDDLTNIDVLEEAFKYGPVYQEPRNSIIDLNKTPIWPETPYVQPLEGV